MIRKILAFIGEYFVFVGGLLFIFGIGLTYSFLKVENVAIRIVFLLIAVGWIVFLIKYFWDILDKNKKSS